MRLDFVNSKEWLFILGAARILLVIGLVLLFIYMYVEIEAVKSLAYDPCRICMNKTGAYCFMLDDIAP